MSRSRSFLFNTEVSPEVTACIADSSCGSEALSAASAISSMLAIRKTTETTRTARAGQLGPRIATLAAVGLYLGLASPESPAATRKPGPTWTLGAPIVTYWAGPGTTMAVDEAAAVRLQAGGWNLGWAARPEDLDTLHRHGLRAMLVIGVPNIAEPAKAASLQSLIERVRAHPALYAYYLVDEPGAGAFPELGRLVAFLRRHDPAHLAYINLFPTYASEAQLQVSADPAERAKAGYPQDFGAAADDQTVLRYHKHLRQFIETVHPDLISYDHYHFLKHSDGTQYFLNLALIRRAALEAGKPFLNIIQTCDSPAEGWRGPGENEVRWLTYTSLAYGAQGLSHFRYDTGFWKEPTKDTTTPLQLYWAVASLNREFLAIASELQPLNSLGAFHCGQVPQGGQPLPPRSRFVPDPPSQDLLLGYFGKSSHRPTHVVVVNLDYHKPVTIALSGPGPMQLFHAPTRVWAPPSQTARVTADLLPGGGALLRLRR
jgi:hypothetical protein